jgi:serine protease Do
MFNIDVNYLDSMTRVSQATGKFEDPVKKIIQKGLQSSCTIFVREGKNQWSGSGFHIGMGMIVTAAHVVPAESNIDKVDITFDGKSFYPASVLLSFKDYDAAILSCKPIENMIPALKLGNSNKVEVGDIVAVIGSPEGFHDTATVGRVSNVHQTLGENAPSLAWQDIIFVDADILEGSSGGMVIGMDGFVYGIVMGVTGQHADIGIGQNSISPSNKIIELLKEL